MKTIKQIADEAGKSKPAVRKQIQKLGLRVVTETGSNVQLLDEEAEKAILQAFAKTNRKPVTEKLSETNRELMSVVSTLRNQLDVKDRQIAEQQESIRELTSALEHTTASLHAAQALHAGTMQKQLSGKKRWMFWKKEGAGK